MVVHVGKADTVEPAGLEDGAAVAVEGLHVDDGVPVVVAEVTKTPQRGLDPPGQSSSVRPVCGSGDAHLEELLPGWRGAVGGKVWDLSEPAWPQRAELVVAIERAELGHGVPADEEGEVFMPGRLD